MYLVKRNVLGFPRFVTRFFDDFDSFFEEDSVVWTPRVDVKETKDAYELVADLPGLDKDDIEISLHDHVLTLKGERKSEEKKEDDHSYYSERMNGSFSRSFKLLLAVDSEKAKAEYKNGVLYLSLPKSEEAKPREIQIK